MALPILPAGESFFCARPWTGFEVENDGTVKPCCMAKSGCGNINNDSIADIWNGPAYQEFRRKMAAGEWQDTCRSDCPRLHGDFDDAKPSPEMPAFAANYETNEAEIESRAIVLESQPRFWKLTHSTLCNIDCVMCYQDRQDKEVLPERFYGEMLELYGYIQEIEILGGEPFAIRRLRDFLGSFPADRFPDTKFSFVTNGSIHDSRTTDLVRNLNVSWMSISLDAATAPTYARIRRGGDFAVTLDGARKWISLGREQGFSVVLAFTVMRDNVTELPLFTELACEQNVDCLFGWVQGTKGDQHLIDEELLSQSIDLTKAVIASATREMPMATLTLESISARLRAGVRARV